MITDISNDEYLDAYRIYYDPEKNMMVDECGFVIFDIFNVISPNELYLFKKKKEDMSLYSIEGYPVLLFYEDYSLD